MIKKIFISTTSFGQYDKTCLKKCEDLGYKVELNHLGRKIKAEELLGLSNDAVGLIAGTEEITEAILLKLPNLKVISRCGVGLDSIDLVAANRLKIQVFNTPDAPTVAVAELTVGIILCLLRDISAMAHDLKNGRWVKTMGNLLMEKKVGIIGFGRIGRKVAELLKSFVCTIAYSDPFVKDGEFGLKLFSKEEILAWADIITIHVADKKCLIDEKELALMKNGSWLVNTSRGAVVNEQALYQSLKSGHLSGAAIDVFSQEPYAGPLLKLDNILLTPHIGSYAKESRIEMERQAMDNLLKGLGEII